MPTTGEPARTTSGSSFAPRASTSVPPATQTFEPLAKSVLSNRYLHVVFVYSAAFTLASSALLPSGDDASFILRLLRLSTWLNASLAWLVGVVPILVVRKAFLEPTPDPASSPSKTLVAALAKPTTRRWIAVYIMASLSLLSLEFNRVWSGSDDVHLSLFIKSRRHPYYLNGRLIFLVLAQVWLAISFGVRNVILERLVFRWAKAQPSTNAPFVPRNLATLLLTVSLFALASFTIYNLLFGLARLILLPVLLRVPLLRSLLRPFVGHFIRGPWTLILPLRHLSLEARAFILGMFTFANWEFAESMFEVYIPQPLKVSSNTADPNVTLVSGITSTDPIYRQFAYAELRDMALDKHASSASRRTVLFSDQKFSPCLWNTLARESLSQLGHDYQTFLRRGAPAPAPATVPAPTAVPKTIPPPATPLLRKEILKAPQQSPMSRVLDTLASDSDSPKVADAIVSKVSTRVVDASIPELFRSTSTTVAPAPPPAPTAAAAPPQPGIFDTYVARAKAQCWAWVVQHSPLSCREFAEEWDVWWRKDRINKLAEKCLPNRDLDALVIEVLAGLVCASLTEDRYGVVQRDIPRILEAFLSFLTALEEYQGEVTKQYVPPTPDEVMQGEHKVLREKERIRVEVAKATEVIGIVADALKSGVADVVRTFGEKLVAFKFPPRIAHKLQAFVDYA